MPGPSAEVRYAELEHETVDGRVGIVLDLDGGTRRDISTGNSTLDHMLRLLAFYANFDLGVSVEGPVLLDDHRTAEHIGGVLGQALVLALPDSRGVERLGSAHGAAEDALALVAVELSQSGTLTFNAPWKREQISGVATESIAEFFRHFCSRSGVTLHIHKIAGENDYHLCEAIFKGAGLALSQAVKRNDHHREPKQNSGRLR